MSLQGNLKDFPIIDIIQLLHGSRKCGILRMTSADTESHLVFHNGDLVSANYLNNRVRIGQVLVSAGSLTEEQLTRALEIQKSAGENRKPLVITLLEQNMIGEKEAYNGLESLIEMTIVEVLTWKEGRFSLEAASSETNDGYHFSKTEFPQRILLNSQGILMESLRIYDEKVRDGSMDEILSIAGVNNLDLDQPNNSQSITSNAGEQDDSAAMLKKLLDEQRNLVQRSSDQSYRAPEAVKKLVLDEYPAAAREQQLRLMTQLAASAPAADASSVPPGIAVIVITKSEMLSTMIRSTCHQARIYAVATDNITSLEINIRLLLCQTLQLVIILDIPHEEDIQATLQICSDLQKYPRATIVMTACSRLWDALGLQALSSGVRMIIPRPCKDCAEGASVQQAQAFCAGVGVFLRSLSAEYRTSDDQRFFTCITRLRSSKTRTDLSIAVLEYLVEVFERAIVFLVSENGLIAEHSFGINDAKSEGIALLTRLRAPLDDQEIFEEIIKNGRMYYGFYSDSTWPHELYRLIGRPDSPEVLLFPFIRANTVIAFIYADFGRCPASAPALHYLEALVQYTTAQISVSAYRQKLHALQAGAGSD